MAVSERVERLLINGRAARASADNAVATVTLEATPSTNIAYGTLQYVIYGFSARFSAAVAAVRTVTLTYTDLEGVVQTDVYDWDFTNGNFVLPLPGTIAVKQGTQVTAALAASGTGGTVGTIRLHYSVI